MLNVVRRGVPGMQLNRANFHQPQQTRQILNPQPGALAALALLHCQLAHRLRNRRQRSLVIEGGSMDVSYQLERRAG
jgi:hypothetical protein